MLFESLIALAAVGFAGETPEAKSAETAGAKPAEQNEVALFPAEREIIKWTNAERQRYGLPPLVVDPSLVRTARNHTFWMASVRILQHAHGAWAENIAQGQTSAAHAVNSWMGSSGHRANILNRRYRRIGVAGYKSPGGDIFWCQQFLE